MRQNATAHPFGDPGVLDGPAELVGQIDERVPAPAAGPDGRRLRTSRLPPSRLVDPLGPPSGCGSSRVRAVSLSGVRTADASAWSGRTKWNRDPPPSSLSAQIRPPWASTTERAMARPIPVPPSSRERGGVHPVEPFEDQAEVLRRDAGPGVLDRDLAPALRLDRAHRHRPAGRAEPERVVEEVEQQLMDPFTVCLDRSAGRSVGTRLPPRCRARPGPAAPRTRTRSTRGAERAAARAPGARRRTPAATGRAAARRAGEAFGLLQHHREERGVWLAPRRPGCSPAGPGAPRSASSARARRWPRGRAGGVPGLSISPAIRLNASASCPTSSREVIGTRCVRSRREPATRGAGHAPKRLGHAPGPGAVPGPRAMAAEIAPATRSCHQTLVGSSRSPRRGRGTLVLDPMRRVDGTDHRPSRVTGHADVLQAPGRARCRACRTERSPSAARGDRRPRPRPGRRPPTAFPSDRRQRRATCVGPAVRRRGRPWPSATAFASPSSSAELPVAFGLPQGEPDGTYMMRIGHPRPRTRSPNPSFARMLEPVEVRAEADRMASGSEARPPAGSRTAGSGASSGLAS